MTVEIAAVLAILVAAIILFVTDKLDVDVVALLVLGGLAALRLVTPEQALSGFSNPAVVTVWAVFILSGGLSQTGIANQIGQQIVRLSGASEGQLLIVIMLISGVISAFMNNIGVAAMFLPVVLDISRQTQRSPSKLLLPLAFGTLLGGMATLISTPANILVSDALRDAGFRSFTLFDYTPTGIVMLLAGTVFMAVIGRRLLTARKAPFPPIERSADGRELYALEERLARASLPVDSPLNGKTLAESRIGRALGLNILALYRDDHKYLSPPPDIALRGGDSLLVAGRLDRLEKLSKQPDLIVEDDRAAVELIVSDRISIAEFKISDTFPFLGKTLAEIDLRRQYGVNVLAIMSNGQARRTHLQEKPLAVGDLLLIQGAQEKLHVLRRMPSFRLLDEEAIAAYNLRERLLVARVPEHSMLAGKSLAENRLANTYGLVVLGIVHGDQTELMPDPDTKLAAGDALIVEGNPADLEIIRGLQGLRIERDPDIRMADLDTGPVSLVEVVLSPYSTLPTNKTLRELHFREKYGLSVLAIWRGERAYRTNLGDMTIRFGDALLLYGPREKIRVFSQEPDFLVLHEESPVERRYQKASVAALLMIAAILAALVGWLPISIATVIGATLMVAAGCLDMDQAYRFIEWKAVFLIAAMLPLGTAMHETGAARFLARGVIAAIGGLGPMAVLAGLFITTALATQFMPNPVVAVLMAPIALTAADKLAVTPYAFMMGVAFAASSSFLSPVGHATNVLVMGPGGYRFIDYVKVGLPLTIILLIVTLLVVPLLWPFAS